MSKYTSVLFLPFLISSLPAQNFFNGQAARAVVGQQNFTYATNGTQQNIAGGASGTAWANGTLFVADSNRVGAQPQNHRVLMFNTTQIPAPLADPYVASPPSSFCGLCGYYAFNVLGEPDYKTAGPQARSSQSLTGPTAVASDGQVLAVADTDNNRVLIWTSIPKAINQPADVVLGQSGFSAFQTPQLINANSLRGPQGVWIQNGKLFVADTQNHRVLVWNQIPSSNNAPADLVLGQPNFTTAFAPPVTNGFPPATPQELLNPVSVTSDGTHLFVSDLGFNRVLIWNTIPTQQDQAADVAVGQPTLTSGVPNWSSALCASISTDSSGNAIYPLRCEATLNYPRYALSDGRRLFIADGGNDRVLIFNTIPLQSGAKADVVLGQPNFTIDQVTSQTISITSTVIDNTAAVDVIPSPTSLAWDGANLYVADPTNRRILLFSPANTPLPDQSVVNYASEIIRQEGLVIIAGSGSANDTVTITIQSTGYTYTLKTGDTPDAIARGLVSAINTSNNGAGDPNATALFGGSGTGTVYLSSKQTNLDFDALSLAASTSNPTAISVTTSGSFLTSGTSATGAAGMLVEVNGTNLSDSTSTVMAPANTTLPTSLAGAQVFMDGWAAPLMSVSSSRIVAQIPFNFTNNSFPGGTGSQSLTDRNSTSIYVRITHSDGSVTITNATPMYIAAANPGLFNSPSSPNQVRPWPVSGATHQPGNPTAVVSIDGTVTAGNTATITVAGVNYTYTVASSDTLTTIAQHLVTLINASDKNVTASVGSAFSRVVLTAVQPGAAGTGISVAGSTSSGATGTVTPYSSSTCCNVTPGSAIAPSNPAVPGELITVIGAGLGVLADPSIGVVAGKPFNGTVPNIVSNAVSATMGGQTAQVIEAGFQTGSIGVYSIQMIVPTGLSANSNTLLYVAQNAFISNTVTISVGAATQSGPQQPAGSGLQNAPGVVVSPTSLSWANQTLIGSNTQIESVTVTNPGSSALAISTVNITGSGSASFRSATQCPGLLAPGASCVIAVTYTSGAPGTQNATLQIFDSGSGSPRLVNLTGATYSEFRIVNKLSGKVLDIMNASKSVGALIQQFDYAGGTNQKWHLIPVGSNLFQIQNVNSGDALDVILGSTNNGALIQQYTYVGGTNQLWNLSPLGNGYFAIVNANSGKVLDVSGMSTANGALIQQWDYLGGDNQEWAIVPIQYFEIANVYSGKALDNSGFSTSNGTLIQQWDYNAGSNQQWELISVDNTYVRIMNRLSGKVLDVINASTNNGTQIQQYDWTGGANQQWALLPQTGNQFAISNRLSGRVLDDSAASTANGALVQQYDFVGAPNQLWQLLPIAP